MSAPRTKDMVEVISAFNPDKRKTLLVLADRDENVVRSANNLPYVKTLNAMYLNVRDLLQYDHIILPQTAVEKINGWLGQNVAQNEAQGEDGQ
jgi:large subunit ribosomal protein L4